jgi:hypothetical protein
MEESMQLNDPIDLKPTAISMQPDAQSLSSLVSILTGLAQARQAPVNSETLKLYALKLFHQDPRDVKAAVGRIASEPRREGETAFPDLGTVLAHVNTAKFARRNKEEREKDLEREKAEFADYVRYRMESRGETLEQILALFPARRTWFDMPVVG